MSSCRLCSECGAVLAEELPQWPRPACAVQEAPSGLGCGPAGVASAQLGAPAGRCGISLDGPGRFLRLRAIPLEAAARRTATEDRSGPEREQEGVMNGFSGHRPVQNVWGKRARQTCPATAPGRGGLAGTGGSGRGLSPFGCGDQRGGRRGQTAKAITVSPPVQAKAPVFFSALTGAEDFRSKTPDSHRSKTTPI